MKISIAMATYNGAKYLQEQLDSFVSQSRLPDELIVTDDASTDDTLSILEKFSEEAPFDVHFCKNERNLGYAANFARALQKCTGDVIFLSDQDDVWRPEKLAKVASEFSKNKDILLVMNDAEIVYENGGQTGLTKLKQTLALGLTDESFTTGCCMAIRREILPLVLPIPTDDFVHDTWINKLAILLKCKKIIPVVMQNYRRHGDNASAWIASRTDRLNKLDLIWFYRGQDSRPFCKLRLKQLQTLEKRLQECGTHFLAQLGLGDHLVEGFKLIERERYAVESRLRFLEGPRWRRPFLALLFWFDGHYRYFSNVRSLVKDLIS